MQTRNLFEQDVYNDTVKRIQLLTPASTRLWGKMDIAQMLAHCKEAFRVPLTDKPLPRPFWAPLIAWAVKQSLYNDKPWKQGMPTSPSFRITDERNFEQEKTELLSLVDQFHKAGPGVAGKYPHPIFGSYNPEQ